MARKYCSRFDRELLGPLSKEMRGEDDHGRLWASWRLSGVAEAAALAAMWKTREIGAGA